MDDLDRLILKNRDSFHTEEPLEGHFERFEARLKKNKKPDRIVTFMTIVKVAAVVIFAILAVNQGRIYFFPERQETLTLGSISEEYREVEFYYTNSIQQGMNQWNSYKQEGLISESEQEMMKQEQQEFDQIYQKLLQDLKANPNDERVINALIEYYQTRMNVLSIITSKLQEIKEQKFPKEKAGRQI